MLRQLSYAIKNQLVAKIPPLGGISCSSLVLYVIRIGGFHARKESIRGAPNRTFPCMKPPLIGPFRAWKPTIPYAIKNQRGASKIPLVGGILRSKAPSRGLWMPELVLYGIRELA